MFAPLAVPVLITLALCAGLSLRLRRRLPPEGPAAWSSWSWLVFSGISAAYFIAITRGSAQLFQYELHGFAYDSLAVSLFQGRSTVAPFAIGWEAFVVEGRTHMYFGPFPALLRMLPLWLAPRLAGSWCLLSTHVAALLALTAVTLIAHQALQSSDDRRAKHQRWLLHLSMLGFGLGTPVFFLTCSGSIYHESIIWGLCASCWGLYFLLGLFDRPSNPRPALIGLSSAAGIALLSRATFGMPWLAIAGLVTVHFSSVRRAGGLASVWAAGLGPAALLVAFQLWYNFDRFGDVTTFIDFRYLGYLAENEDSWRTLQEAGNFNPLRLPSALAAYIIPSPRSFSSSFPFIRLTPPAHLAPELYPAMFWPLGRVASLALLSPWLVGTTLLGAVHLFGRSSKGVVKLCGLVLLGQVLLVMSYYILEHRYTADFLPFMLLCHAFWLRHGAWRASGGHRARAVPVVLGVFVAFSVLATASANLSWIPVSGPFQRAEVKARVFALNDAIDGWFRF